MRRLRIFPLVCESVLASFSDRIVSDRQSREDIFNDGLNTNGRGKFAAEHFYTINKEHSYSAEILRGKHVGFV